jgi:hypothetical protein
LINYYNQRGVFINIDIVGEYFMKKNRLIIIAVISLLAVIFISSIFINAGSSDYTNGVDTSNSNVTIGFKSNVDTYIIYKINSGTQLNYRMTYNSNNSRYEQAIEAVKGDTVSYSFTYNNGTPAYDSEWYNYTVGDSSTDTSSEPEPTATVTSSDGYSLKWSDEFEESTINRSNWTFDIGNGGWGNNELEYYTDRIENARIEDGNLVIEAKEESYNGSTKMYVDYVRVFQK